MSHKRYKATNSTVTIDDLARLDLVFARIAAPAEVAPGRNTIKKTIKKLKGILRIYSI